MLVFRTLLCTTGLRRTITLKFCRTAPIESAPSLLLMRLSSRKKGSPTDRISRRRQSSRINSHANPPYGGVRSTFVTPSVSHNTAAVSDLTSSASPAKPQGFVADRGFLDVLSKAAAVERASAYPCTTDMPYVTSDLTRETDLPR